MSLNLTSVVDFGFLSLRSGLGWGFLLEEACLHHEELGKVGDSSCIEFIKAFTFDFSWVKDFCCAGSGVIIFWFVWNKPKKKNWVVGMSSDTHR